MLQCVAVCCSVLQCVAVCCSVLQCVAVCCSVLQCVAVCCSAWIFVIRYLRFHLIQKCHCHTYECIISAYELNVHYFAFIPRRNSPESQLENPSLKLDYSVKRSLYSIKRALYSIKRALYSIKVLLSVVLRTTLQCIAVRSGAWQLLAEFPYLLAKFSDYLSVTSMGWLQLVGSIKFQVSFADYCLFYRVPSPKRLTI